jgi:hypothetical protein
MKKKDITVLSPEAYVSGYQPSMSNSAQLIECSYAFGREFERRVSGEPARYGSSFHEVLAHRITASVRVGLKPLIVPSVKAIASKWGEDIKPDEVDDAVKAALPILVGWLKKNEFRIDFDAMRKTGLFLLEKAVALTPLVSGRSISGHDEDHRYHNLVPGELPGTLDLAIIPKPRGTATRPIVKGPILMLDHKTGEEDFSKPLEKAQLLSLGAAVMRWVGATEGIIGVLHARRRGMPKVYADHVKLSELKAYETRLQTGLARIGDGSMRPGPWCKHCEARSICPAKDAELLQTAGDVLTGLTAAGGALSAQGLTANDVVLAKAPTTLSREKKLGTLYSVVRKAETIAARARAEIKSEILAASALGQVLMPETLENEYLVIREYTKENLSKKGITDAYGKIKGEKMLEKLRADGAITESKVQQLYPEKERGR